MVPPAMEGLKPAPKHFRDRLYTADYIKKVMAEGRPGSAMAPFPKIQGQELDDLAAFLNSLFDQQQYKEE